MQQIWSFLSTPHQQPTTIGEEDNHQDKNQIMSGDHQVSTSGHQLRVDWSLQEATLENSYLSALSSHTSYFYNIDVAFFVVEHILLPGFFFFNIWRISCHFLILVGWVRVGRTSYHNLKKRKLKSDNK